MTYEDLKKARARALRAAQVVTLGFALAGGSVACSDREDGTTDSGGGGGDSGMVADSGGGGTDSGTPSMDSGTPGTDSGTPGTDSGTPGMDAGGSTDSGTPMADATAGCDAAAAPGLMDCYCPPSDPSDCDCCIESGGFCGPEGSCAIPGPFVPPSAIV
jgi:hypothetical protein